MKATTITIKWRETEGVIIDLISNCWVQVGRQGLLSSTAEEEF